MEELTVRIRKRICKCCGSEFVSGGLRYCSEKCRNEASKLNKKELIDRTRKKAAGKEQLSIEEINMLALDEHISYGQYVAKYGV